MHLLCVSGCLQYAAANMYAWNMRMTETNFVEFVLSQDWAQVIRLAQEVPLPTEPSGQPVWSPVLPVRKSHCEVKKL